MNIVCVICSDLLEPSSDVYHTPCGHIFHFQCLTKWIERSKSCPQCREKTTTQSIRRIYFNFSNDYTSHLQTSSSCLTDNVKLQDEIHSLNFKLSLAKNEITNLTKAKEKLQSIQVPLKQTILRHEETIKNKESIILALKDQLTYCKTQCAHMKEKNKKYDERIKTLSMKLEKLQSVQDILDASTDEVDHIMNMPHIDIPKLQTFISVLKRELENSIMQRKQLREKIAAKSRATAELSQVRSKMKQLEETLKIQMEERTILQAKLLKMQTAACNYNCDKITVVEKKCLNECKKYNSMEVPIAVETEHTSNSCNNETLEIEKDNNCIITAADNAENTPQSIKAQGFFSMTNRGIKRTGSSVKVPSILAKKPMNFMNLNEMDQLKKKIVSSGMTFDGFGGHAKYDKFPKSIQNLHTKKGKDKTKI